jgi:aryl-alcohol dehydrogenase-like predicted oxidoreductase
MSDPKSDPMPPLPPLPPLPTVRFGRTGVMLPRVSLGTWAYGGENLSVSGAEIGWSGHDDAKARAALVRAHALGITHWDTADVYGDGRSEALIGDVLASGAVPRQDIFLATKVGWSRGRYPHFYHPDLVRERIDESLGRLGTDVIDLYYLHHCDFGPDDRWLAPALEVIRAARDAGKIRFIGLSDWSDFAIMRVIAQVDPDVVQPYRNVTRDTFMSSGLAGYCDRHDVGVAFFSPIRHGLLLGKYAHPETFPHGDVRNSDSAFRDPHVLNRLARNAATLRARFAERNPEPVLAALLATCLVDCDSGVVLLGQRDPAQVEAAARAATLTLSDEELAWVRSLYAGIAAD